MAAGGGYEKSAHLYDLFDDKENLEFFLKYAAEAGDVLDVGAGTGRIAIPLARAGAMVTCVEPSPSMRREFNHKLEAEPEVAPRIELVAASCAEFSLGRTFPLALLSGCFDHFLTDGERLASLGNVAAHLNEGGRLLMDSFLGLMGDSPLRPAGEVVRGDVVYRRLVGRRALRDGNAEVRLVFETHRAGGPVDRIDERSLVGVTTRRHIRDILEESGFSVDREFGNYRFAPYEGQDLVIVDAVKARRD